MYVYIFLKSDITRNNLFKNSCNNYAYRYFVSCFGMTLLFLSIKLLNNSFFFET